MKLSKREKESLQLFEGKKGKITFALICFLPVFLTIMALLNFKMANDIASIEGNSLMTIFSDWVGGDTKAINLKGTYTFSGISLLAENRFFTALTQITAAFFYSLFASIRFKDRGRDKKIIELLKKHNEWED